MHILPIKYVYLYRYIRWSNFQGPKSSHYCSRCHVSKPKLRKLSCLCTCSNWPEVPNILSAIPQMPSQLWALYLLPCSLFIFSSFLLFFLYPIKASCPLPRCAVLWILESEDCLLHEVLKSLYASPTSSLIILIHMKDCFEWRGLIICNGVSSDPHTLPGSLHSTLRYFLSLASTSHL